MKDELPLNENDFAAIRKSVMTTIAARQARRSGMLRVTQLAFVAIALLVGAWWMTPNLVTAVRGPKQKQTTADMRAITRAGQAHATDVNHDNAARTTTTAVVPGGIPPVQIAELPSNPATQQPSQQLVTSQSRNLATPVANRHRRRRTQLEPVVAAANDGIPIRLELRTADPDIRIIWISNPTESR
jgi:cytoskeletal protein RodZ